MSDKKQVLIICHSAAGQMYFGVLLSRIWFSPVLARTPDEGIRLARKSHFSLILLDGDVAEPELKTAITLLRSDQTLKGQPLVVCMTIDNPDKNHDSTNEQRYHQQGIRVMYEQEKIKQPVDCHGRYQPEPHIPPGPHVAHLAHRQG